jgi:hypothetical protein
MSPRYFSKFTQAPRADENWYHFTPSQYEEGSYEFKIHVYKLRVYAKLKKIFRIK